MIARRLRHAGLGRIAMSDDCNLRVCVEAGNASRELSLMLELGINSGTRLDASLAHRTDRKAKASTAMINNEAMTRAIIFASMIGDRDDMDSLRSFLRL
jgi:hypothetical protein